MAAANQVPGAIEHYCVFNNGSPVYLGTAVLAPDVEQEKGFDPVMNDLGGRIFPFQNVYDGEEDTVLTTLNRFDYTVYKLMRATVNVTGSLGTDGPVDRGTLVFGTQRAFGLVLVYSYAGSASAPSQPDMPAGRFYPCCTLEKNRESTAGARVMEIALAIKAHNLFNPSTRSFTLYTETLPSVPAPG